MSINKKGLGRQIRKARTEKELTQQELADRIGITPKYLVRIETGERTPSMDVLALLANALEVSLDLLLSDSMDRKWKLTRDAEKIMKDCSPEERDFLMNMLKYTRELLRNYK